MFGQIFRRGGTRSLGNGAAPQQICSNGAENLSFSGGTRWSRASKIGGTTNKLVILYLLVSRVSRLGGTCEYLLRKPLE